MVDGSNSSGLGCHGFLLLADFVSPSWSGNMVSGGQKEKMVTQCQVPKLDMANTWMRQQQHCRGCVCGGLANIGKEKYHEAKMG